MLLSWTSSHIQNSASKLNLFGRYSNLKNLAFWLALRFSDHNSRTRFFPNMLFLQKVKKPLALSYWNKKAYISEWIKFLLKPWKSHFYDLLSSLNPSELFFYKKKPGVIRHFSYFMMSNFMEKIRKNWLSRGFAMQTDGKTSKAKFIGHFC